MKALTLRIFSVAVVIAVSNPAFSEPGDAADKAATRAGDRAEKAGERAGSSPKAGDTGRAAGDGIESVKDYGRVLKELNNPDKKN